MTEFSPLEAETFDPIADAQADPFLPGLLPPDAEQKIVTLASIEPEGGDPECRKPKRYVCRAPGGLLYLVDVTGAECTAVGKPVTFAVAGDLASAILAGDRHAATHPAALRTLALAFIAALVTAEKRRRDLARSATPVHAEHGSAMTATAAGRPSAEAAHGQRAAVGEAVAVAPSKVSPGVPSAAAAPASPRLPQSPDAGAAVVSRVAGGAA